MQGWISYILSLQLVGKIVPMRSIGALRGAYIVRTQQPSASAGAFPENRKTRERRSN
jgi:hypothetical protein